MKKDTNLEEELLKYDLVPEKIYSRRFVTGEYCEITFNGSYSKEQKNKIYEIASKFYSDPEIKYKLQLPKIKNIINSINDLKKNIFNYN